MLQQVSSERDLMGGHTAGFTSPQHPQEFLFPYHSRFNAKQPSVGALSSAFVLMSFTDAASQRG